MLEIIAILALSALNAKTAAKRGRNPVTFRLLTVGLWLGAEILGFLLGTLVAPNDLVTAYIFALVGAVLGGAASVIVTSNCKEGERTPERHNQPTTGSAPLPTPCTLTISRKSSVVSCVVPYTVYINGHQLRQLKNGESMTITTPFAHNVLLATDAYGHELKPLYFSVPAGGNALAVFAPSSFLPAECQGMQISDGGHMASVPGSGSPAGQVPAQVASSPTQVASSPTQVAAPATEVAAPTAITLNQHPGAENPISADQSALAPVATATATDTATATATEVAPTPETAPTPAETMEKPALAENPLRAVWAGTAAIALIIIAAIIKRFGLEFEVYLTQIEYFRAFFAAFLGISAYLLVQRSMKFKAIGAFVLLIGVLIATFESDFTFSYLIIGGATGLVSTLIGALVKSETPKKHYLNAGINSVIYVITSVTALYIDLSGSGYNTNDIPIAMVTMAALFHSVMLGGAALITYVLCSLRSTTIITGVGAKIWFVICAGFTSISAVTMLFSNYFMPAAAIVAVLGVTGYLLLLVSQRIGFPIVLFVVTCNFIANLSYVLNTSDNADGYTGILLIVGLLNPVITWLLLHKNWQSTQELAVNDRTLDTPKPPVPVAFEFGVVLNLFIASGLMALFLVLIFSSPASINETLVVLFFPSLVLFAVAVPSAIQCFSKAKPVHQYLQTANLFVSVWLSSVCIIAFTAGVVM